MLFNQNEYTNIKSFLFSIWEIDCLNSELSSISTEPASLQLTHCKSVCQCIECQKYNFLWCKYFPCTSTQLPFWQLITVTSIADKWHRSFWKHFFKSYRLFCTVNHFTNISRTATFCSVMISHAYIYSVHLENVCGSTEHSSNLNWSYAKLFCPDR